MKLSPVQLLPIIVSAGLLVSIAFAAPQNTPQQNTGQPLTPKQLLKRQKELQRERAGPWKKWLNEDVLYIISDQEKRAFKRLQTDDECEQFVEQFWARRDPTPDTEENEFKDEHYRRIAYADEQFASSVPGWKTDRGMIYIKYGPPDAVESHPAETSTYPAEDWTYRRINGLGSNVKIEFVDLTKTGDYHVTLDPAAQNALLYTPGTGFTLVEQMSSVISINRQPDRATNSAVSSDNPPPIVKFKDLEAVANSGLRYDTLPMLVRTDYIRATDATVLAILTVQFKNSDLPYATNEGIAKSTVNIYGRVTSLTGRSVDWFEDSVVGNVPVEMVQGAMDGSQIYSKTIPLAPGTYRLNVVAKDLVGNTINTYEAALNVPDYNDQQFASSGLILADLLDRAPNKNVTALPFLIRSSRVRPRMNQTFKQKETMGVYAEFYNLGTDQATRKLNGTIEYQVVETTSGRTVLSQTEDLNTVPKASAFLVIAEKKLPLKMLSPGQYTLKLKIFDKLKNQTLAPSAQFTVTS